jgi:4'-phosphopantetheinyl transferase
VATRYIIRQGILRELIASYTDLSANELEFVPGPYGKPYATGSELAKHISFNVSHSHGVALYAVTKTHAIGIDVEYIQPLKDINLISREIFTDREAASLPAHPGTAQTTAFYRLWTRKEAYLKACGIGLGADPAALEMPDMSTTWRIVTLYPRPSYIAALALRIE